MHRGSQHGADAGPLAILGKLETTAVEVLSVLLMGPVWGVGSAASWFYMLYGQDVLGKAFYSE